MNNETVTLILTDDSKHLQVKAVVLYMYRT